MYIDYIYILICIHARSLVEGVTCGLQEVNCFSAVTIIWLFFFHINGFYSPDAFWPVQTYCEIAHDNQRVLPSTSPHLPSPHTQTLLKSCLYIHLFWCNSIWMQLYWYQNQRDLFPPFAKTELKNNNNYKCNSMPVLHSKAVRFCICGIQFIYFIAAVNQIHCKTRYVNKNIQGRKRQVLSDHKSQE